MEDFEKIYELLQKIEMSIGIFGLISAIIIGCVLFFGSIFIKSLISKAAQEGSDRSLAIFQNELDRNLETQVRMIFKDLDVRNQIHSRFGIESISVKIELWKEIYKLYFDFQEAWDKYDVWLSEKQKEYLERIHENRIKIFLNSIYLGGDLTQKLIHLNSTLRNSVFAQHKYYTADGDNPALPKFKIELDSLHDSIHKQIFDLERFLSEILTLNIDSKTFEINDAQLKSIDKERTGSMHTDFK